MEPAIPTLTIVLTDGSHSLPVSELNVLSKSSFSMCYDDVSGENAGSNTYHCDYLTKSEFLMVVDMLHGKTTVSKMNKNQLRFVEANLLLPLGIVDIETVASKEAAKLVADAKALQTQHIALMSGASKLFLGNSEHADDACMYKQPVDEIYSKLDYIVPIQIALGKDGVQMVCICEGVPIWTQDLGDIAITSDNLYETRSRKSDGMCITFLPSKAGACIKQGGCDKHPDAPFKPIPPRSKGFDALSGMLGSLMAISQDHKNTNDFVGAMTSILDSPDVAEVFSREILPLARPKCTANNCIGIIVAGLANILTENGCMYMRKTSCTFKAAYCLDHLPYIKHTATQDKADAVMRVLRTMCLNMFDTGSAIQYCSAIQYGYVNIL